MSQNLKEILKKLNFKPNGTAFALPNEKHKGEKMSKELQILQKHLGNFEGVGEFATKQLCAQISDANDFIGALQVLDISLKKLENNLKERCNAALSPEQAASFDSQNAAIIANALFMGAGLFGTHFSTRIGSQEFSFEIQEPFAMLENAGFDGVLAYITDKREQISALFDELDGAISQDFVASVPTNAGFNDFKELLR